MLNEEKAPSQTGAKDEANYKYIVTDTFKIIKSRHKRISLAFWQANYFLEEERQEYSARGHLWRQIRYCFALLVFRFIGRLAR